MNGPLKNWKKTVLVTLMTDASVCGETRVGGYGFWVVSERGGLPGQGAFKHPTKDSLEGEMKGVVNSLAAALKTHVVEPGDKILIQLDNQGVIKCIEEGSSSRKDIQPLLDKFKCIVDSHQLTIECRHVKGHSNRKDSRYRANNLCDMRAKEEMRKARQEYYRNQK